jgi:prevent-host-death family protein
MRSIPATEFKAKCLELMDRVAERQESFIITKRGTPVAKLTPLAPKTKETWFGCLQDQISIEGDLIAGPPLGRWEAVEEWDELAAPAKVKRRQSKKPLYQRRRKHS